MLISLFIHIAFFGYFCTNVIFKPNSTKDLNLYQSALDIRHLAMFHYLYILGHKNYFFSLILTTSSSSHNWKVSPNYDQYKNDNLQGSLFFHTAPKLLFFPQSL